MAEMSENDLLSLVSQAEADAAEFNGSFSKDNERLLKDYFGEPYGDEVEGQSQVVSTDVADVVEADMPSLARVFLGPTEVLSFVPSSGKDEDIQEAEDKTKYVDWLVRKQPESFATLHGWLKDAEIQKMGVIKYFIEDTREPEEVEFTGLDRLGLQEVMESLRGEDVSKVEIIGQTELDGDEGQEPTFDILFRVTKGRQKVRIVGVPTESFLISKGATSLEDAAMVGDKMHPTRGELVAQGFDKDIVATLPTFGNSGGISGTGRGSTLEQIRNKDQGGVDDETINDPASEEVEIIDMVLKIDFDGDGIAERRHIIKAGDQILENEMFNHIPYATLSSILMPHKAIGRSRAEITQTTQRVKTVLTRQMLDNGYMVNNSRNIVSDDVNLDDMLTVRPNGIVRTNGPVQEAVFPLITQYTGDKTLQIIQYMDIMRAQSTGTLLASQGLQQDDLNQETATRFQGVQDEGTAKIELVARNYAETGWRKLYEGIAWLVARFQDTETEFMVLGKALTVDPSTWKFEQNVDSNVGLGAGDNEKIAESLASIYNIQRQLQMEGSPLVDNAKLFNTLQRVTKAIGLPRTDEFFNDPEQPEEVILSNNEQLIRMVQQLQQKVEALQNPLAEAETIRAQEKRESTQVKGQLQLIEAKDKREQFDISEANKMKQHDDKIAVDLTKLEVENNEDIPGSIV